jgi:drug/metabolite transporter (DMT)-like permease
VTLIEDALNRRFNPWGLLAALVAVAGAAVIRYDRISPDFFMGFLLLQLANFTYAAGQVLYKHLVARHPSDLPHYRRFGYFYLGALAVVLPAFLLFGKQDFLPEAPLQWAVLLFLGLVSTALGLYWWNKGACLVTGATLAVMNNLHVPVGLLINLLIWNQHEALGRLFLGALVILAAVWISRRGTKAASIP